MRFVVIVRAIERDLLRVQRIAQQQPPGFRFGFRDAAAENQPARTLHDKEAADDHRHGEQDRARIHPAPRRDIGILEQNHETDCGAGKAADRLKAERAEHHAPADAARHAFRNDQVRGRIVTTERNAGAHEGNHNERVGRTYRQQHNEADEERHLDDEHLLAAIPIRQVAQRGGADENAEQGGGGDDALLHRPQIEFFAHQRQRDPGHEHDHALEKLAGGGEPPDQPLHTGDRGIVNRRRVRPDRRLVDVFLDGLAGACAWRRRASFRRHEPRRAVSIARLAVIPAERAQRARPGIQ